MKCPKCGYLGFDQVDRCRNCGYELALAARPPAPELPLQDEQREPIGPLDDLGFLKETPSHAAAPGLTPDLPLFEPLAAVDDAPLITKASPPRQPLAVRRTTPDTPRLRAEPKPQSFDLGFESAAAGRAASRAAARSSAAATASDAGTADAGVVSRLLAVAIDVLILAAVDLAVVYLTVQICGMTLADVADLPRAPLLAFLVLQNGGYLVAFTAGGQTLGKMALGIRVVTAEDGEPLGVGRAGLRILVWTVLAIPAGLGFLTALWRPDRRGLHDRFAGTRVVRASA